MLRRPRVLLAYLCVVLLMPLANGCASSDSGVEDTGEIPPEDTGQGDPEDTSLEEDTAPPDSTVVDTGAVDSNALVDTSLTRDTSLGTDTAAKECGASSCVGVDSGSVDTGRVDTGRTDTGSLVDTGTGPKPQGPAYDAGTASCPADDGVRRIKFVNNCTESRWFKLDGRTTPTWARKNTCPWAGRTCSDPEGITECTALARSLSPNVEPGNVYCKASPSGGAATCACNPYFQLAPGQAYEIAIPSDQRFQSGTGWLAIGCNALGAQCSLGNGPERNSVFEFSFPAKGETPYEGHIYYDISAVNAWTKVSAVGMRACHAPKRDGDKFWCNATGCRFDVNKQCPDGSASFASAPTNGCTSCPNASDQTLTCACSQCEGGDTTQRLRCGNGQSANGIAPGTQFVLGTNAPWTWNGSPDLLRGWGYNEGLHANRRYSCDLAGCAPAGAGAATTCLGGCDLCLAIHKDRNVQPGDPECIKYCCPDVVRNYGGNNYRYDSPGCTALGVQGGTDYTSTLKAACPNVYTYGYEDHSSTFVCDDFGSLVVQACPDPVEYPASL